MSMGRLQRLLPVLLLVAGLLGGCVTLPRASFSAAEQAAASPPRFEHVRYRQDDPALAEMLAATLRPNARGAVNVLAISGGGANGAFGAGLLYGWGRTGGRPQFQLVTGVSAGALAAPFAFLGPEWNERLRQSYAGSGVHHLLKARGLMILLTPGLFHKAPLSDLVHAYVTDDLLRAVAVEQAKGRRLLVATTNLDTEELIVWDMGAIAAHGGPEARELFAQVLTASATVPGVFAPTMIEVEAGGRRFAEMHVDGQTDSAFFAIPLAWFLGSGAPDAHDDHHLFILVNGRLDGEFAVTPRATIPIIKRTVDTVTKASLRTAILSTLEFCRRNGCGLSVAAMPSSETDDPMDFGAAHIQRLFAAGQAAGEGGRAWKLATPALSGAGGPGASAGH